ncbi:MAG: protein-L-isoaspartate(D-aspartate) O-methyltransferase [Bacteroidales bacterium]|jgi:protein-L-isoaspartate(D-aspartate) O-methyltransferase|nr:protein-L-isoaspartate(D-aspartate) O-methyltransferase [Bacteroidales bacterium]
MEPYLLKGAKYNLINLLREKGITDERILKAFDQVERHLFITETFFWDKAYQDIAIPIGCNQTISAPSTVAFQTQLLNIAPRERVLEIGTGSGFQAAILCVLGAIVFTIERQVELHRHARALFKQLHLEIPSLFGDGFKGSPEYAPFDKILVTCGAPNVPEQLLKQLKVNGVMVIPVGDTQQTMKRITKIGEDQYEEAEFVNFTFVPMLSKIEFGK